MSDIAIDYERKMRLNDRQYEITLPAELSDADGLENGDLFAFTPELENNTVAIRATLTDDTGARNVRRLRRAGEWDQTYLRFPKVFADERGWGDLLDAGDVQVSIEHADRGEYVLRTWPATKPAFFPTAGETVADTVIRRFIEVEHGGDSLAWVQYRLEIPSEIARAYGIEGGERLAARLTARDGELMLAMDFDVDPGEVDGSHVRKVFQSSVSRDAGAEGDIRNYGVLVPRPYADALGLAGADFELVPEDGQLLFRL